MHSDKYKVKILHYINPHLIWVLVKKDFEENSFLYEQIGIYGISPLDIAIDDTGFVQNKRCGEWLSAVFAAMKSILLEAKEVWFSVTYLDRTTSIFDNNLHKYGDLIITMKDGITVSMTEELLKTGLVTEDLQHFHQNLKTKLDYVTSVDVINKIKQSIKYLNEPIQYLENQLTKQTSVFQHIIEVEEVATANNPDVQLLLHKHVNDLNACKDIDEKSAGRANSIKSNLNRALMRKLNLSKLKNNSALEERFRFIEKKDEINNSQCNGESKNINTTKEDIQHMPYEPINNIKTNKKAQKLNQNPDKGKKFVAIGPPGLNPMLFHRKEVQKEEKEIINQKVNEVKLDEEPEETEDIFCKTDSEVNIKIDNLDNLKQLSNCDNSLSTNNSEIADESELRVDKNNSNNSIQNLNIKSQTSSRKMKFLREKIAKMSDSSSTGETDSIVKQGDDSDSESIISLVNKLDVSNRVIKREIQPEPDVFDSKLKSNVNPFKNLDGSKSVFVDKLISPTLMVHTKNNNLIQPVSNLRDVPFGTDIHVILRNMSIRKPMRLQTVSWPTILRGHSLFLVSPYASGKTLGYLPAVCRLVNYNRQLAAGFSVAQLSCIIVCATAKSVSHVEELCRMFLHGARIFACYNGMTDVAITTSILNGCDILISTPTLLVHLMRENLGLDLRNLNMFVVDDCERISEVYQKEIKFCLFKIKEMLKNRVNKEMKVQYIVTSRIWCDFMSSLAKKAPDSVVCIAAFQECVLYSSVDTSVEFLKKESKLDALVNFLKDIDKSKKTVIACRSDDEVHLIEKMLIGLKYIVFASDSNMTVHDLYSLDLALSEYEEPLLGPILVCCDGNLTHLNMTDAHYLVHFSLPELFSMFCKRFAVVSDNYRSIFDKEDSNVKIKVFLEETNVEQLPKILNFIKRCSADIPTVLDQISDTVILQKEIKKAKSFIPLCNALLTLGKCPDIWNCQQRHAIFQEFDEPKPYMPREGVITFKILHYHSAVHYSARMISCANQNEVQKYAQTYSTIMIKLGMYYSKESNKKLHGLAKPGDICSVSLKLNLFARCQVLKILKYNQNNQPSLLLVNLIDEEKYELVRDTCLYYLPDDLKKIDSQAIQVILSNIAPLDRDITYSKLAENRLKKIAEANEDLYMRGEISLVIGNCIFIETLEACQDLSSLNETVVKSNFRNELLDGHAINNLNHIKALEKLGANVKFINRKEVDIKYIEIQKPIKVLPKARWAHLESDNYYPVYYLYAKSPTLFFVQHVKFQDCLNTLLKDIKKYVAENPEPVTNINEGDIVIAEFPDDKSYERARIDSIIDNTKVKCFFVDLGDWATVSVDKLLPITEKIITQLPFQAIECKLVGMKPVGEKWSDFSTTWLVDQFYDTSANLKYLYAKQFTKEKAEFTEFKYGIGLIDTYVNDVYINKLMIDANLAEENEEIELLDSINIEREKHASSDDSDINEETPSVRDNYKAQDEDAKNKLTANNLYKVGADVSLCIYKKENEPTNKIHLDANFEANNSGEQITVLKPLVDTARKEAVEIANIISKDSMENETNSTNTVTPIDNREINPDCLPNEKNDQQVIMNLLKKPLRSVPLVEDDDFDDDKWDSINPLLMLTNSNQESNIDTVKDLLHFTNKATPAICYTKSDAQVMETKDEPSNLKQGKIQLAAPYNGPMLNSETTLQTGKISTNPADNKICMKFKSKPLISEAITDSIRECRTPIISNDTSDQVKIQCDQQNNSFWDILVSNNTILLHDEISSDILKEIKLTWVQDNKEINIKIHMTTKNYQLVTKDKELQFYMTAKDAVYGFQLELYGVIDVNKSSHCNKDTYIEIKLIKVMSTNWLTLSVGRVKKILMYVNNTTNIFTKNNISNESTEAANVTENMSTAKENDTIPKTLEMKRDSKLRQPKLIWHQNRNRVIIKIQLITDNYDLNINDKYIRFSSNANDEEYGFEFELYGVVDVAKSAHSNKGQYIQVNLFKVMPKNWFNLSKGVRKWIAYDVDGVDVSSDDEDDDPEMEAINLRNNLNINLDSESDDDFNDDTNFLYKRND